MSTPGPWKAIGTNATVIYTADGKRQICTARKCPEARGNARLIALSPEMYEALQSALPFIDDACDAHTVFSASAVSNECRAVVATVRALLAMAKEWEEVHVSA